jgi:hypothetical protein
MDDPNPQLKGTTSGPPAQPAQPDGSTSPAVQALESAFARGSGQMAEIPAERSERAEHSIMEGLPQAKAERVAAMRRELAELQRQLIEAQQKTATELQGRAEDAERIEALESRLQARELKAQQDAARIAEVETEIASLRAQLASATARGDELERARQDAREAADQLELRSSELRDAKALLDARDTELAMRTQEREADQACKSRLERELEEQRKQYREVAEQLESQLASLREAKALAETRDADLTAITSDRDALKGDLERLRREHDAMCEKTRAIANQLVRLGHDLTDGAGVAPPADADSSPTTAATPPPAERLPPPVPAPRAKSKTQEIEVFEVTDAATSSSSRTGGLVLGGIILSSVATIAIMKWTSSSATDSRQAAGALEPSALAVPLERFEPHPAPAQPTRIEAIAETSSSEHPAWVVGLGSSARPEEELPPPPSEVATDGTILLPEAAAGHRLFVDGRVVEVKSLRAVVRCGTREIRIGSRGTAWKVDVECGGETVLADTRDR